MPTIHPTALVSDEAKLADDTVIGPYAIIDGPVKLGEGCIVAAHAQILGSVEVGAGTSIGHGAIIGADPQDLSFDPAIPSHVKIGEQNTLRELVTIHRGSKEGSTTRIGDRNFLMAGTHLGHDTLMGDDNILANNCLLAGHVTVGNKVFLGGGSVFHQFIRIGDLCLSQGNSAISKDVPPFCVAQRLNKLAGVNVIGLRRAGIDSSSRSEVKNAYHLVFRSGLNLTQALQEASERDWGHESRQFLDFLAEKSAKGVCFSR